MRSHYTWWARALSIFALTFITIATVSAQRTLSGTIIDVETEEPLIGANILVVGTSTGTVTDYDGNYELEVPDGPQQIRVTYTGYSPETVDLTADQATFNLEMRAGELLDEVVVIGYGSVRKEDLTGAISSIGERDFQSGVIANPEQLIQGRVAGVQITENSGEPGGGINVRIRGTSSVRSGNGPLYVVDGVPLSGAESVRGTSTDRDPNGLGGTSARNPLAFINPNDIESITVLKDASAAAIYGSRGANGVVIVKTKSGAGGDVPVEFNASIALATPANQLDLLDAGNYVDAAVAAGSNAQTADLGGDTDWQDEIYRGAISQNYGISFGGGSTSSNYRFSVGYLDQEGIVENSSLERFTARVSANQSFLNDRLDLAVQLTGSRVNDEFAPISNSAGATGDLISSAIQANPTRPIYIDNDPTLGFFQTQEFINPVALLSYIDDNARTTRLLANVTGGIEIFEGLRFQTTFGYDNSNGVRRTSRDRRLALGSPNTAGVFDGFQGIANTENRNILLENTLAYNRDIGGGPLSAVVGYAYQQFNNSFNTVSSNRSTLPSGDPTFNIGGIESPDRLGGGSDGGQSELQSYFGRLSYTIADKYLLTATVRADGSSRFGSNNRYGTFPSASVAWRLSEEDFIPESFYDLKLRVGYGITGNQEFENYRALARTTYDNQGGQSLGSLPNPDLKWEETSQLNVGIDYGFLGGRVLGSLDYFNKVTTDLLFITEQPGPTPGQAFTFENLPGDVVNNGVELSIDARVVESDQFTWQTILTGSYIKNEVKNLGTFRNTGSINGQGLTGAYAQRIADGQPLFAYYLLTFDGYDSEGLSQYANNDAFSFVGDPLPDANVGWANNFTFGALDFGFFLQGVFGYQVYNNTANAIFLKGNLINGRNSTVEEANSAESPRNFGEVSTRFLEDGSFVRLQNLNVGYNVPTSNINGLSQLRVYATVQNLFVITEYTGYDPEVNTDKSIDGVPSLGIDYTSYPKARTFQVGANVSF